MKAALVGDHWAQGGAGLKPLAEKIVGYLGTIGFGLIFFDFVFDVYTLILFYFLIRCSWHDFLLKSSLLKTSAHFTLAISHIATSLP